MCCPTGAVMVTIFAHQSASGATNQHSIRQNNNADLHNSLYSDPGQDVQMARELPWRGGEVTECEGRLRRIGRDSLGWAAAWVRCCLPTNALIPAAVWKVIRAAGSRKVEADRAVHCPPWAHSAWSGCGGMGKRGEGDFH